MTQIKSISDGKAFQGASSKERAKLDQLATVVTVPAGRVLTEQGERGREFGVILEGEAAVEIDGKEVARLGAGDHYGEMALLDKPGTGPGRRATVTALTPITLAAMTVSEFRTVISDMPEIGNRIMQSALERSGDGS